MSKNNVTFKPHDRPDGRWAIGVYVDDKPNGFVHWIDLPAKRVCRSSRADICFSVYSLEEAVEVCADIKNLYDEGAIE